MIYDHSQHTPLRPSIVEGALSPKPLVSVDKQRVEGERRERHVQRARKAFMVHLWLQTFHTQDATLSHIQTRRPKQVTLAATTRAKVPGD